MTIVFFFKRQEEVLTILLVYVDGILILGPSKDTIDAVKTTLHDLFKIKDLG